MGLPIEIITMDSLMQRWSMSFSDTFFLALNHELTPVYREHHDPKWQKCGNDPEHDILDVFLQDNEDPASIIFLRSDVRELEQNAGGKISKSTDVISEVDLIERWGMSKIELWNMQETCSLEVVDPLGITIEDFSDLQSFLITKPKYDELVNYFRLSEVKRIENEYDLKTFTKSEDVSGLPTATDKTAVADKVPEISFYKKGQAWLIGPKGKESIFMPYVGFDFIRFLLRYPEERHDQVKVYFIGSVPEEIKAHLYEKDFHKYCDSKTVKKILNFKNEWEQEYGMTSDPDHQEELAQKIEQCEKFLKGAKNNFSGSSKNYRTKILNDIKRAIEVIKKESKDSKSLELVLKYLQLKNPRRTIFTGNSCCYLPNSESPVTWQLDPPIK
jgi:hypothetical protein